MEGSSSANDRISTWLKQEILELKEKGHTIIFSTHNMASVEEICDNIALINKSQVVLSGNVAEVRNRFRNNTFTLRISSDSVLSNVPSDTFTLLCEKEQSGIRELVPGFPVSTFPHSPDRNR